LPLCVSHTYTSTASAHRCTQQLIRVEKELDELDTFLDSKGVN
jgi:hypothetical protein